MCRHCKAKKSVKLNGLEKAKLEGFKGKMLNKKIKCSNGKSYPAVKGRYVEGKYKNKSNQEKEYVLVFNGTQLRNIF